MTDPIISEDEALAGEADEAGALADVLRAEDIAREKASLQDRCRASGIPLSARNEPQHPGWITIEMDSGRDKRAMTFSESSYGSLLAIPFEDFVFLSGLNAICNYKTGYIEVGLEFNKPNLMPNSILVRNLLELARQPKMADYLAAKVCLDSPAPGMPAIEIGIASEEFSTLFRVSPKYRLTLKLYSCNVTQHDAALNLLRKISSSALFQLDLLVGSSLSIQRDKSKHQRSAASERQSIKSLKYPTHEYEGAPISLFAYGRSADGMPLLQYLAFYQVVEFHFPMYSLAEAHGKIKNLLKSPLFRSDNDGDISMLLAAASTNKGGAYGDERSQLKATLNACVTSDQIRDFVSDDPDRLQFFSSPQKSLKYHRIPVTNKDIDLIGDVAERIYNIRCKIVHSKADSRDSGFELLLPFSKEAEMLPHDIALIQFVARHVLIAGSSPLNLHN